MSSYIAQPWNASDPVVVTSAMQAALASYVQTWDLTNFHGVQELIITPDYGDGFGVFRFLSTQYNGNTLVVYMDADNGFYSTQGTASLYCGNNYAQIRNGSEYITMQGGAYEVGNPASFRSAIRAAGNGYTTTATSEGILTLTATSNTQQFFTGTTMHTVVLPIASTMTLGNYFVLENNSTGVVNVKSSGANLVVSIVPGQSVKITCILTSGTNAASWDVGGGDFVSGTFGFDNYYTGGAVPIGLDSTKVYYENGKYWNYNSAEGWWSALFFGPGNEVYTYGDDSLQVVLTTQNYSTYTLATSDQYLTDAVKLRTRNNISAAGNGYTTTATAAGTLTLTATSNTQQFFTGTTTHTVVLPVTSSMTLGNYFVLENNSTGIVTVNSSGSNLVVAIVPGTSVKIACILTSGTSASSWDVEYTGFNTVTGTGGNVLSVSPTLTTPTIARTNLSANTNINEQASGIVQIGTTAANALGSLACANVTTPKVESTTGLLTLNAGSRIQFQTGGFDRFQIGAGNDFYPSVTNAYNVGGTGNRVLGFYGGTLDLTGSAKIGAGTAILKVLSATATLDFGSVAANSFADLTITVTGAAVGDTVSIGVPNGSLLNDISFFGWVSATNTVTVRCFNASSTTARDPASGTFRATVTQF